MIGIGAGDTGGPERGSPDADLGPADVLREEAVSKAPATSRLSGPYPATVTRVIDGDTVEARVTIWLYQEIVTKVRLRSIDAPEIRGACGSERDRALVARDRVARLVEGRRITLVAIDRDKYFGRVTADVLADGVNIADSLLAEGLARPYAGGRRGGWCGLAAR